MPGRRPSHGRVHLSGALDVDENNKLSCPRWITFSEAHISAFGFASATPSSIRRQSLLTGIYMVGLSFLRRLAVHGFEASVQLQVWCVGGGGKRNRDGDLFRIECADHAVASVRLQRPRRQPVRVPSTAMALDGFERGLSCSPLRRFFILSKPGDGIEASCPRLPAQPSSLERQPSHFARSKLSPRFPFDFKFGFSECSIQMDRSRHVPAGHATAQ